MLFTFSLIVILILFRSIQLPFFNKRKLKITVSIIISIIYASVAEGLSTAVTKYFFQKNGTIGNYSFLSKDHIFIRDPLTVMKITLLETEWEQCVHLQDSQMVLFLSIGSRLVPHSLLE